MAIIVPMIPAEEGQQIDMQPFSVSLRDAIEENLLEHGLLYRGIAVKVMQNRIPQSMQNELLELRDQKDDIFTERREEMNKRRLAALGRVRRAWEEMWKASK